MIINKLHKSELKRLITAACLILVLTGVTATYSWRHISDNQLEQVLERGKIRFVMRTTGAHHAIDNSDISEGFDYRLAELFAEHLGVDFEIIVANNVSDALDILENGKADIAIGLTRDVERSIPVHYSTSYKVITEQVVYKRGATRPRHIQDLTNGSIRVSAETSHAQKLAEYQIKHANLEYVVDEELDSFDLMALVVNDELDYTIVDSHDLETYRRFYPELQVAFKTADNQGLAWGLKPVTHYQAIHEGLNGIKSIGIMSDKISMYQATLIQDTSLAMMVDEFLVDLEKSGELEWLLEVYYGHLKKFDYIDTTIFIDRIKSTLPRYEEIFRDAADNDLDWLLLAAIGYQESHWNPNARSPTGVRGVMMLTTNTARSVGVTNRLDPTQSIQGGAAYFRRMHEMIPDSVQEPDRTWMALASYNIGYGHLADVRKLVQRNGGDPNKWADVREWLPKKHQEFWYSKTRHGYARGREAVVYVENIRRYYDLLGWLYQNDVLFLAAV